MLIVYFALVLITFAAISYFGPHLNYKHELKNVTVNMYNEANFIANNFTQNYNDNSKESIVREMSAIAVYYDCDILLLSTMGEP